MKAQFRNSRASACVLNSSYADFALTTISSLLRTGAARHAGSRSRFFPYRLGDAQEVATEDLCYFCVRIAGTHEFIRDRRVDFRAQCDSTRVSVLRRYRAGRQLRFTLFRRFVEQGGVQTDADVIGPDQLHDVVDVAYDIGRSRLRCAQKDTVTADPDHATTGRAAPDEIVRHISGMRHESSRVGVREYDGFRIVLEYVVRRTLTGVTAAGHHPERRHLVQQLPAEAGQTHPRSVATASREIIGVIGNQHPAHAQVIEQSEKARILFHHVHPFDIERDRQSSRRFGGTDIGDCLHQAVAIDMGLDPAAHLRQQANLPLERHLVVADIETDDIDAGSAEFAEPMDEAFVCVVIDGQVGMVVPDQRGLEQTTAFRLVRPILRRPWLGTGHPLLLSEYEIIAPDALPCGTSASSSTATRYPSGAARARVVQTAGRLL